MKFFLFQIKGQYCCTTIVETFILSYILYLTFEAPFVNIIKIIFVKDKNDTNGKPVTQEEEMDSVSENNNINEEKNNNLP